MYLTRNVRVLLCVPICKYAMWRSEIDIRSHSLIAFLSYHLKCHLSLNFDFKDLTRLRVSKYQFASPVIGLQTPLDF